MRGELDRLGWKHYDIPIGNCDKCEHQIYRDEDYERTSYIDITGNNNHGYSHKECPKHTRQIEKITVSYRCLDCGVVHDEISRHGDIKKWLTKDGECN